MGTYSAFPISNTKGSTSSFLSSVPGATASASMADRFANLIVDVKADFGATGDGSTDDTAAIQAAINWTTSTGFRGIIFFPVGTYKVTGTITLPSTLGVECSIILRGCGMASKIAASGFTGYVFQRLSFDGSGYPAHSGLFIIEDLSIEATAGAGISGIKIQGIEIVVTQRLELVGLLVSIYISVSNFNWAVRDVEIKGGSSPPISGSFGILNGVTASENIGGAGATQGVEVHNVTITNVQYGQRHEGGVIISNYRCEESNIALHAGFNPSGSSSSLNMHVTGMGVEACDYGILGHSIAGVVQNATFTGDAGDSAGLPVNSTAAVKVQHMTNMLFERCTVSGPFDEAGIATDNTGTTGNWLGAKFNRCTFGTWVLPSTNGYRAGIKFEQSDNPAYPIPFGDLPGQGGANIATAVEGMEYDLNNSNTATWGATVAGGGSNHVSVRYNGTNWTVVGK